MDKITYDKLRQFYWVPLKAPWDNARGPFRWSGPTLIAHRHPTIRELSRYADTFDPNRGAHPPPDGITQMNAEIYLAERGKKVPA